MDSDFAWEDDALHEVGRLLPWGQSADGNETGALETSFLACVRKVLERIKHSGCLMFDVVPCWFKT
jgi:hypothetical protein